MSGEGEYDDDEEPMISVSATLVGWKRFEKLFEREDGYEIWKRWVKELTGFDTDEDDKESERDG